MPPLISHWSVSVASCDDGPYQAECLGTRPDAVRHAAARVGALLCELLPLPEPIDGREQRAQQLLDKCLTALFRNTPDGFAAAVQHWNTYQQSPYGSGQVVSLAPVILQRTPAPVDFAALRRLQTVIADAYAPIPEATRVPRIRVPVKGEKN